MILSGEEISQAIQQGEIALTPEPDGLQYSQSAVDLRLGDTFLRWNQSAIEGLVKGGLSDVVDPSAGNFSTLAGQCSTRCFGECRVLPDRAPRIPSGSNTGSP